MSKRVADGQGGADRYGGMDEDSRDSAMDPPRKATAAQLAKRSIKPLKGRPASSRSSSPSKVSQSFPPNAPTNAPTNAFAPPSTSSFNFAPSGSSFTFGPSPASPAPSAPASPAPAFNPFATMSTPSFSSEQAISPAEIHEIESAGPRLSREGKLDQLANIVRHSEPRYKDADLGGLNLSALPPAVQRKMLDFVRGKNEPVSLASAASFSLSRHTGANGPGDPNAPPLFAEHMPHTYTHLPAFAEEHFMLDGSIDEAKLAQAAADAQMPCAWQTGIAALQSRLDKEKTGMKQIHSYQYFQPARRDSNFTPPTAASFNPDAFAYTRPFQPFNSLGGPQSPFVKHPAIAQATQHVMLDAPQPSKSLVNSQQAAARPFANNQPHQTPPEAPKPSFSFSSTAPAPAPAPAASTSFSFGATTTAAAPSSSQPDASSPFKGFGAAPTPASPAPSSGFKFGSTAEPTKKDDAAPTTFTFGGFGTSTAKKDETPAKAPTSAFNFGGPAASPAPAASSSFSFGTSTTAPTSPAPASPAPASPAPAPASAFSFGGAPALAAPATSSSLSFGTSTTAPAPPAPASAFNFGASTATPASPAPMPSFGFGTTTEKKHEAAPQPPTSAFNFGAAASPAAPPSPKPAEKKLPAFAFGAPAAPKPAEEVSYPSLDKAPLQEASPAPTPSFSFGQTAAPAASSPFKPAAAPESPRPQNAGLGSSMFGSAHTQQKPAESAFKGFGASTSTPSQPTASTPTFGFGSSTSAQAPPPSSSSTLAKPSTSGVATPPASPLLQASELGSSMIKQLNESLRAHLASADASQDWSAMMHFYLEQVADIRQEDSAAPSTAIMASSRAPKQITAPLAPPSTRGEKRVADEQVTKHDDHSKRSKTSFSTSTFSTSTTPTKPLSSTASLFDDILKSAEKPQTPQPSNVFSASAAKTRAAPATTPPVKSNPFGNIVQNVSATPAPAAPSFGFIPPAGAQAPASSNPLPAAPAFQIPKFGNGSSTAATPSFLGSFGQKAAEQEAKEREKRKEEDMDSDDDEEEWERRDAEKQAQKKADLLAASQALKFNVDTSKKTNSSASAVFKSFGSTPSTANTSASSNIFGNLSASKPDDEDKDDDDTDEDEDVHAALANASPAKPTAGKSLFDRVSFDGEKEKNSDTPSASFKFSSFGSSGPASDNTWKDTNPIKFGASTATAGTTTPDGSPAKAPAPKFNFGGASQPAQQSSPFGGMFGAKPAESPKPASSGSIFDAAKPSAPTTGFSFGGSSTAAPSGLAPSLASSVFASAATSRATTPGATTTDADGSAAESEPSDTPNDTQKDLTALTAEELATSNLIHEARCKVTKFVKDAENKTSWVNQGLGPIRILANKETSKPRILVRADPSGKVVLNFNLLLNKDMYTIKNAKMVQLSVPAEDKKLETFMCMFKDGGKAQEFLDKLHETIVKAQG